MKKITMKTSETIAETFDVYLLSKRAKGISDKTLTTYKQHFDAISHHLPVDTPRTKGDEDKRGIFDINFTTSKVLYKPFVLRPASASSSSGIS